MFSVDTSCVVAAVCAWHEFHAAAAQAIGDRLQRGERLAVAAHVLVEAYAVLTRLPPPHRLSPSDAGTLIRSNFVQGAGTVALSGTEHAQLVSACAAAGVRGGRSYDALIAACARKAGASTLLTFNPRHFDPGPAGVAVVVPSMPAS